MTITARYSSTLLISANPLVFNWLGGIKVVPILLLLLLYLFSYLLIKELLINNISKIQSLGVSSLIIFVFLCFIPDAAYGIYFLTTAITFFLPNILLLAFFYFLIKSYRKNKTRNRILSVFVGIFVVGGNEHSMFIIFSLIILINLYSFYKKRYIDKFLLSLAIIIIVFTVIQLLALGNLKRSFLYDINNSKNFLFSLKSSIITYFEYLIKWLPLITFMILLSIKYFDKELRTKNNNLMKFFSISPFIMLLGIFAISIGTIFIIYWSVGTSYFPHRSLISTFIFNIFGLMFFSISLLNKLKSKVSAIKKNNIFTLIIIAIFISFLFLPSNRIRIAYGDLIKGRAYEYNKQFAKRYDDIQNCKSDTCVVDKLTIFPTTVFVTDITDNCDDERNKYWAWYFNKKAIKTKK